MYIYSANYTGLFYDELLAEENKQTGYRLGKLARNNLEKVIILGTQIHNITFSITPNLAGPALKKRFMGGRQ